MHRRYKSIIFFIVLLTSCQSRNDYDITVDTSQYAPFEHQVVQAEKLALFTLTHKNPRKTAYTARVYIEGDGGPKENVSAEEMDPTPAYPMGLYLAQKDPHSLVIYMARPCQYVKNSACHHKYWSDERFSQFIIDEMNIALSKLKTRYRFKEVELVGFSGGAIIASHLALKRHDVTSLRTVAGPLHLKKITDYNHSDAFSTQDDPINYTNRMKYLPQLHFAGGNDQKVPSFTIKSYVNTQGKQSCAEYKVIENASHFKGWVQVWPDLLQKPLPCQD